MNNLQKATVSYQVAKQIWMLANCGQCSRSIAVKHLNKARPWLKREIRLAETYLGRDHRV